MIRTRKKSQATVSRIIVEHVNLMHTFDDNVADERKSLKTRIPVSKIARNADNVSLEEGNT